MRTRFCTLVIAAIVMSLVTAPSAEAGGLLKKLFGKKCGCAEPEPTCCCPAPEPECPEPEPTCCCPAPEPTCPEPEPCCPAPEPACPAPEPACCPAPEPPACCGATITSPSAAQGYVYRVVPAYQSVVVYQPTLHRTQSSTATSPARVVQATQPMSKPIQISSAARYVSFR
jgi:hypothetical protein